MNIIRMTGGLGNQMFGYALYLSFQNKGIECKFDDFSEYEGHDNARPIELSLFGIDYPKASKEEVCDFTDGKTDLLSKVKRKVRGRRTREYKEASCNFDPNIFNKDNAYLTGYFQSEKYFADVKDKIIETYTFKDPIPTELCEKLKKSCSIHIRRGDYLTTADVFGGICTKEYYDRAIRYIEDNSDVRTFMIFSDDPEFAEKEEKRLNQKYGSIFSAPEGYVDIQLMSMCAHNICANSSYSWWGAYLNQNPDKITVVPNKWFNDKDMRDIYTDRMVRL